MSVTVKHSVVVVKHEGMGTAEDAELLGASMLREAKAIAAKGKRPAIFHDSENLKTASQVYARGFVKYFSEIKKLNSIQVALISRSYLRVLAQVVMTLSRTDMKIFETRAECFVYLKSEGYDVS